MNLITPISAFMTKNPVSVTPDDSISLVKQIFEKNRFHHIVVLDDGKMVGIISKSDFNAYFKYLNKHFDTDFINNTLLSTNKVSEIMTPKVARLEPDDTLAVAVEVFKENRFHALPIVKDGEVVGIVTIHDIICALSKEKIYDSDYKSAMSEA
jgi:acetoin utilization protein AcuB